MPARIDDAHRAGHFWSKVDQTGACWLWTAYRRPNGYGTYYVKRVPLYAHRYAFELEYGPIPPGLVVRHRCDTPACCRPDHLELGTLSDNSRDALERGRAAVGERSHHARVSAVQVDELRRLYRAYGGFGFNQRPQLSAFLGVRPGTLTSLAGGTHWRWSPPATALDGEAARDQRMALREVFVRTWRPRRGYTLDLTPEQRARRGQGARTRERRKELERIVFRASQPGPKRLPPRDDDDHRTAILKPPPPLGLFKPERRPDRGEVR